MGKRAIRGDLLRRATERRYWRRSSVSLSGDSRERRTIGGAPRMGCVDQEAAYCGRPLP